MIMQTADFQPTVIVTFSSNLMKIKEGKHKFVWPLSVLRIRIQKYQQFTETPSKQESPPVGNRKKRTARGVTCPSISYRGGAGYLPWLGGTYPGVPLPILTWLRDTYFGVPYLPPPILTWPGHT